MRRSVPFLALSIALHLGAAGIGVLGPRGLFRRTLPTAAPQLTSPSENEVPLGDSDDGALAPDYETHPSPAPPKSHETENDPSKPPAASAPHAPAKASKPEAHPPTPRGGAGSGEAGLIGAVGEPGAILLESAFLRALAQVASFDHEWTREPLTKVASISVVATVDQTGHLRATIGSTSSLPLERAVTRVVAQLAPRKLTAHGATTHLTVTCSMHNDEVHDGFHGDVFALGASAQGRGGTAFFALATGRRVDFALTSR